VSDDDLRALERAVHARGLVDDRLRLAAALERAGREDEALRVLSPVKDEPQARARIAAQRASWAFRGFYVFDVPLLARAPVARWTTGPLMDEPTHVLAGPLGAALVGVEAPRSGEGPERHRTHLLDIDTGSLHATLPGNGRMYAGDVILIEAPDGGVEARDLRTADVRWACPGTGRCLGTRDGLLQWSERRADTVWLREGADLRPPLDERRRVAGGTGDAPIVRVEAAGDLLLLTLGWGPRQRWSLLQRDRDEPLAGGPGMGVAVDGEGVLVRGRRDIALHDVDGRQRWAFVGDAGWLSPGGRVAWVRSGVTLTIIDRATGTSRRPALAGAAPELVVVRDGAYVLQERLRALGDDGAERWSIELDASLTIAAALPDRLLGSTGDGAVVCLGE
jgi:hypothetical protein